MDSNEIKSFISSPPDRDSLVAEIFVGNEQIAEIHRENNEVEIEIYSRKSGEWWKLNYKDFIEILERAKQELNSRFD